MTNDTPLNNTSASKFGQFAKQWLPRLRFPLFLVVLYFANHALQSYWGRDARDQTGFAATSFKQAKATAQEQGKQILVDVSAVWCGTCRKLDKVIFSNPDVQQVINDSYIFMRVEYDSDDGDRFIQDYGVRAYPTLLVLNAEGQLQRHLQLTFNPQNFISQLN